MGFPGGSEVKASACNVGDLGSSLGQKDPLEKEMATHSSILAWTIPWTEEPGGLQSKGRNESDTTKRLHFHLMSSSCSTFSLSGSWGPGVCLADTQSHSKGSR